MNQIKCPNCGEVFTIDESSYDSIVKQIRDHQFNEELRRREKDYEEKLRMQLDALKQKTLSENLKALNEKDLQIEKLKSELSGKEKENELLTKEAVDELQARLQEKENLIVRLDADLKNKEMENKVDLAKAVAEKEEEITHLKAESDALKQSYVKQLADKDELEYVELFLNKITDLTPLANKPALMDLNIYYNRPQDLSPLATDTALQRLWLGECNLSSGQISAIKKALPNCKVNYKGSSSTGNGWREHRHYTTLKQMYKQGVYIPFS